ncbi:MAG: energy transducer TonB [Aridibacter sp.]
MAKFIKSIILILISACCLFAQTSANAVQGDKLVKWEPLNGKDNELILYMPQGFKTIADSGYDYIGPRGSGKIEGKLLIYRYINGVILFLDYYTGDVKQIQKSLEKEEKSAPEKIGEINGFDFKQFTETDDEHYKKKQYYRIKDRLYILTAVAKSEDNEIIKDFFQSVKLINDNKGVSPNVPSGITSITLSGIKEKEMLKFDDSQVINDKEADRPVVILNLPRPKFPIGIVRNLSNGKIILKALFAATGQVTKVEVLDSPSKELSKAAIEAIKKAKFLPAEKDGKLISVYIEKQYSFKTTTNIVLF